MQGKANINHNHTVSSLPVSSSQVNSSSYIPTSSLVYSMNTTLSGFSGSISNHEGRITALEQGGGENWILYKTATISNTGCVTKGYYNQTAKLAKLTFSNTIGYYTEGCSIQGFINPINAFNVGEYNWSWGSTQYCYLDINGVLIIAGGDSNYTTLYGTEFRYGYSSS